MIAIIPTPLADHDPLLLDLLTLATETVLAHPENRARPPRSRSSRSDRDARYLRR